MMVSFFSTQYDVDIFSGYSPSVGTLVMFHDMCHLPEENNRTQVPMLDFEMLLSPRRGHFKHMPT